MMYERQFLDLVFCRRIKPTIVGASHRVVCFGCLSFNLIQLFVNDEFPEPILNSVYVPLMQDFSVIWSGMKGFCVRN